MVSWDSIASGPNITSTGSPGAARMSTKLNVNAASSTGTVASTRRSVKVIMVEEPARLFLGRLSGRALGRPSYRSGLSPEIRMHVDRLILDWMGHEVVQRAVRREIILDRNGGDKRHRRHQSLVDLERDQPALLRVELTRQLCEDRI